MQLCGHDTEDETVLGGESTDSDFANEAQVTQGKKYICEEVTPDERSYTFFFCPCCGCSTETDERKGQIQYRKKMKLQKIQCS